jgi:hypothetical protein
MDIQYKHTGNQINIPMNEMINFVHDKLYEYDEMIKATETMPNSSPYKDPVYYTTEEGKMVQIPDYVQKQAVSMYMQSKVGQTAKPDGNSINQQDRMLPQLPLQQSQQPTNRQLQQLQQSSLSGKQPQVRYIPYPVPYQTPKKDYSKIKIFLIITAILVVLYFVYKSR